MAQDTVTIACKIPNGIFLQAYVEASRQEPVPGGGYRDVKVFEPSGEAIRINGYSSEAGKSPRAMVTDEGYALTTGVPKELWELWKAQHHDQDMIRNGLIFAHGSMASVNAESREHDKTRNGMEPMAQKDDPRAPKSPRFGAAIEPAIV